MTLNLKSVMARAAIASLVLAGTAALPGVASAFVLGGTAPGKWGDPTLGTSGGTVTWSLMATGTSCTDEFAGCTISSFASFLPSGFLSVVQAAFGAWTNVADINFLQVADDGAAFNTATASGNIRLGGHLFDGVTGVLAHGYFPPANGGSAAGDIHLDTAEAWTLSPTPAGFDLFQVLTHEIGHAIGLDHTGVPASLMNPYYTTAFSGPQSDDIAGVQTLYGAPVQNAVPGPASALVFVFGLAGLGWARRDNRPAQPTA